MSKEFDFLNDKALVVINDREPVKVVYEGQILDNLSAKEAHEEGVSSVAYQSEYNKNLLKLDIKGNTKQNQYQGYNLFDYTKSAYVQDITITNIGNGITVKTKNTSSSSVGQVCFTGFAVEENTKYYIKLDCAFLNSYTGKTPNYIHIRASNNTGTNVTNDTVLAYWNLGTSEELKTVTRTVTVPTGYKYLKLWFYANVNQTTLTTDYEATLKNIIVSKEDVAYEPYVAGAPSPSVDYPQPIENSSNLSVELSVNETTTKVSTPIELALNDYLVVNYVDKSVIAKRNSVKLDLAALEWQYEIISQTNVTAFHTKSEYQFTGNGLFNRGTVGTITNADLNNMENTVVVRIKYVYGKNELEIVFSPDFDVKQDANATRGDVQKLMAWFQANPCEVLIEVAPNTLQDNYIDNWTTELLNLPTQNATNVITITSSIPTSKLSVDYAEWGGNR